MLDPLRVICSAIECGSQVKSNHGLLPKYWTNHSLFTINSTGAWGDLLLHPQRHTHKIIHHHCKCFFTFKLYTHWQSRNWRGRYSVVMKLKSTIPVGFFGNEVQSQAFTQNTCANVQLRGTSALLSAMERSWATCRQWIYCSISCGWGLLECFYLFVAVQRCMGSRH